MTNKGFNPLFVSALDILTGALGVFIILNFLNTKLIGVPPVPANPPALAKKTETGKLENGHSKPADTRGWWRKPTPAQPQSPRPVTPVTQTPQNPPTPENTGNQQPAPPTPPQDPVAVDLMKQTKGAVVILLQQSDQAKASVEFMLRQGNKTWKPTRASKYQNSDFQYEKALTYFFQTEIQPGTYEVLVRVKKGQRNAGSKPFSLYGKIIPPGQKTITYSFGTFAANGSDSDWIPAGYLKISGNSLNYQSKLPAAPKTESIPAATAPQPGQKTGAPPASKPSGKTGKWG